MLTKSLEMCFIGLVLSVATVLAGPSAIQGVVKDAKGQAIKGADVRIESRDGKQRFNTVKTDATGHYISQGLQPGVYRVTLRVNGAVKASIMNTSTKADQATQLNFDLKPASASQASTAGKKGKHMVWVPSTTGSHIGGRWVEVDANDSTDTGALNVKRAALKICDAHNNSGTLAKDCRRHRRERRRRVPDGQRRRSTILTRYISLRQFQDWRSR